MASDAEKGLSKLTLMGYEKQCLDSLGAYRVDKPETPAKTS